VHGAGGRSLVGAARLRSLLDLRRGERGLDDEAVLRKAFTEAWVLLTNDADFGTKVFRERRPHRGVVFLRLADERNANKIEILRLLLEEYSDRLADRFVVVSEKQVRFARD
jgi:predicted nuclease of predicted toxin-antitoxin system